MKRITLLLHTAPVLILLGSLASVAQISAPPTLGKMPKAYPSRYTSVPFTVDGRLDEEAWKSAPWTEDFVDIQGDAKPKPRLGTRVKMLWDDTYFYVGAELQEGDVWGTLRQRDTVIFYDNDFEIFMDPDGDHHEYYEMEMNALNTVWDLFLKLPYRDGGRALDSWDIRGLRTAVSVEGTINNPLDEDSGWTAEVAIPWAALAEYAHRPCPPREGDQWRINFSRVEWQVDTTGGLYRKRKGLPEDNWVWSPQGVIDMHRPEMWGYVEFRRQDTSGVHPDPAFSVRCLLDRIYYAQREFHAAKGGWAGSLEGLREYLGELPSSQGKDLEIGLTPDGYTASVRVAEPGGKHRSWHIRQDSRLWAE